VVTATEAHISGGVRTAAIVVAGLASIFYISVTEYLRKEALDIKEVSDKPAALKRFANEAKALEKKGQ
jgi:hypothetical protein